MLQQSVPSGGNVMRRTESELRCCCSQVQKQPGSLSSRCLGMCEIKENPLDAYVAFGQGVLSCASEIL